MSVHERAVVHPSVTIDPSNEVGANVLIEAGVVIGKRNVIMPGAYLGPGTTIGNDNQIHLNSVLGHVPQDRSFAGEPSFLRIGDRNIIREFVTIHRGTKPGSETVIGDDCFLMSGVHIAHNCRLGNHVVMVSNAAIAGHVELGDRAWISNQVGIHQFVRIGRLVMFSAMSISTQDVPPFVTCGGTRRAHALGINVIGMRRAGVSSEARQAVREAYKVLYRRGLSLRAALDELHKAPSAEVQEMARFIADSKRGIIPGPSRRRLDEELDSDAPLDLE